MAPAPTRVRARLLVAYHGAGFSGFAANAGVRTVAGELGESLARLLGHPVDLVCAGRTDKGVHGWGQVVSFDADADRFDPHRTGHALNRLLGPEVVVRAAEVAEPGFDARHDASARTYRYRVLNRAVPDPFLADRAWHVPEPLELAAMRLGCDPLLGEHDFSSFCRRDASRPDASLRRRVESARWDTVGDDLLEFEIRASAFCHQMVRSLVGTLVDIGRGRFTAADLRPMLAARDRQAAGQVAPPHGLVLWHVDYPGPVFTGVR